MFRYQVRLVQRIYRSLQATLRFDLSSTEPTWSVWSKTRMDSVFQVSRVTNKVNSYQEEPNTLNKHQTARASGLVLPRRWRTKCALELRRDEIVTDATTTIGTQERRRLAPRPAIPACHHFALPTAFVSRLARRRTGVSSCSVDHMTRSYDLGLIILGIGIDRHPSLRFSHGHPRYLDISSTFSLRLIPPFRMCSDGYERNKTVLKNGDSRLVGSSDWPRRTRDLNQPVLYSKHWNSNTVRCSHNFCGSHFW
ncbi:BQ5605_C010g06032 [Microbotryum silenes-dioicae]|uniref:BQ5605_C010g06028 protein n=1 Tax=Microbotryum silenes-dioicae TaxID=796604 RepID=A0A2X0LTN8_9BASI|nr:BQ5605_C010g06028 [Microbotryum silenes-dioicae]SGY14031.1 BQ5605_C010g06032 [Microbotryum silenes-dioicae]